MTHQLFGHGRKDFLWFGEFRHGEERLSIT